MRFKRALSIILAVAVAVSAASCGGEKQDNKLTLGTVQGNVYTNDFFDLKVEASEGFSYADDETIQAIGLSTADKYAEFDDDLMKDVAKDLKSGKTITDFYLSDEDYADSLNFMISYGGHDLQDKMIENIIDESLPMLQESYDKQGLRGAKCERSVIEFCGRKIPCIKINASVALQGGAYAEIYQTQIQFIQGDYLGCLTATTYIDDTTEDMLNMATVTD